jgi:type VI secretion system secreted protein VgrG
MREKEYITEWCVRQEVQPKTYTHTNFDFKLPRTSLVTTSKSSHQVPDFEIFDYPGEHENTGDGDNYARRRMEEMHADFLTASGTSDCRGNATGYMFTLTEHPRQDQNQQYLVTSTHIDARNDEFNSGTGQEANYTCTFTVIVATEPFRSARITPKPMIRGPQTAIVVGKAGEEIWTDEHGRVKVQFHWDRYSNADENSSCWIRVAQLWAGKKWGGMYIPRIGHEVIVEFLEGDPDRPIVTGRVYNGEEKPPYELPANATRSTIKSNSSKGSDGFNEFRFEDKKGQEQVFVHAEKDMDTRVKNDSRVLIIHDSHEIVGSEKDGGKQGDRMEMVYRDKHVKVHRNQMQHIGGNMELKVGGIDGPGNQDIVIKATKKELIEGDEHHHVKGNFNEKVDTDQSLTVGSNLHEKVGANYAMEAGMAIHVKGGMTVVIEAGMQLTLKVGGNFVDISPVGVTIQGTLVNINSGGAPGSGSGSSPTAPQDAKEAAPTEPAVADDAKAGGMVEPPKPTPPKKVGWYKSQTVPGMQGSQEEQETAQKRIEFQLLDPNGDPMPDERFEVKMPDGSTRSGKTDSEGKLRYDNVEGENPAEIRFPDLGDDEWKRIGADDLTQ